MVCVASAAASDPQHSPLTTSRVSEANAEVRRIDTPGVLPPPFSLLLLNDARRVDGEGLGERSPTGSSSAPTERWRPPTAGSRTPLRAPLACNALATTRAEPFSTYTIPAGGIPCDRSGSPGATFHSTTASASAPSVQAGIEPPPPRMAWANIRSKGRERARRRQAGVSSGASTGVSTARPSPPTTSTAVSTGTSAATSA
mmetsp:Transcript_21984/g.60404  ORF Transcript_21984/g.60404 Transcript_21984/m.60404 type:complete len:200 (+) Transcript_21984:2030-2629(+)|eukprot:scaffold27631_cov24-Tisochrysis_lutea.AAC.2